MNTSTFINTVIVTTGFAALVGCSGGHGSQSSQMSSSYLPPAATQGAEATPEPYANNQSARKLSDGQIVQAVLAIDNSEIQQAQIARDKANAMQVKDFASLMIDQHTQNKQTFSQLASQNNLSTGSSPISNQLEQHASQIMNTLKSANQSNFDQVYMNAQIQEHQNALNLLNSRLLPSVQQPDVTNALQQTQALLKDHLSYARQVLSSLQTQPQG